MSGIEIVTHTYEDPRLNASLFALYDTVWGFLRAKEAIAGRLGFPWREISTPVTAVLDGEVVAHAGLLEIPVVVAGRGLTIGGVHAVLVKQALRGQGLGRRMLEEVLALADARGYPATVLASEKEALYAKFGFRPRALHVYVVDAVVGGGSARALDLGRAGDAAIWVESMRTRAALSDRFSVIDRGTLNAFDAVNKDGSHAPLWFDEGLGVVYFARQAGSRVVIDDVFAARPFDGKQLLAGVALAGQQVAFGCDPELLGLAARAEHAPYAAKDDRIQIRGALVDDDVPVAWPAYSFM